MLNISWQRFQLLDPYLYRGESRSFKESAFLALGFKNQTFTSELSVFPGLHETNRDFYHSQIPRELLKNLEIPDSAFRDLAEVTSWAHQYYSTELAPNTLQALDTLLLEVLGQFQKLPKQWQSLYQQYSWCCTCAQLITRLEQSLHLHDLKGTYKIKMGRANLAEEIQSLKQWLKQNPKATVRLDANEMWSPQEIETLLSQLSPQELSSIEYLEDPCSAQNWTDVSFSDKPDLALENIQGLDQKPDVRVYRPSSEKGLLLGMSEIEKSLKESAHLNVVLSSSFETELGLRWLVFCARILGLKRAQGLGTLTHLRAENPVCPQSFKSEWRGAKLCISRN